MLLNLLGVEGLDPNDDGKEIKPGVYGIGAIAIDKLKVKTESEMIKYATAERSGSSTTQPRIQSLKSKTRKNLPKKQQKALKKAPRYLPQFVFT